MRAKTPLTQRGREDSLRRSKKWVSEQDWYKQIRETGCVRVAKRTLARYERGCQRQNVGEVKSRSGENLHEVRERVNTRLESAPTPVIEHGALAPSVTYAAAARGRTPGSRTCCLLCGTSAND